MRAYRGIRHGLMLATLVACKAKHLRHDDAAIVTAPSDARAADAGTPPGVWPELASLPHVDPVRVIALPARPDVPRFNVGGPVLAGDVAVVSSSQFGFIAVDFRRSQIAWSKPAGAHVAPPQVIDGN